jgi:hypothetical protein
MKNQVGERKRFFGAAGFACRVVFAFVSCMLEGAVLT